MMNCPFCKLDHVVELCPALAVTEVSGSSSGLLIEKSQVQPVPMTPGLPPPAPPVKGISTASSTAEKPRHHEIKYIYGMNIDEYQGLTQYSGAKYRAMNAILRVKRVEEHGEVIMQSGSNFDPGTNTRTLAPEGREAYVRLLISIVVGMLKIPKWNRTKYTLRGAPNFLVEGRTDGLRILPDMQAKAQAYKKGDTENCVYADKGLMSTTAGNEPFAANSTEKSDEFILFVTMLPDLNHGGRCIKELAKFVGEDEVLFMPDQQWDVVHVAKFKEPYHKRLVAAKLQNLYGYVVYLIAKEYDGRNPESAAWAIRARSALNCLVRT